MAHEMARGDELEVDDEFVYYVDLPTLKQMASYQACVRVWQSYISSPRYILSSNKCIQDWLLCLGAKTTYRKDIDRLIEGLRAPRCIKEMLEEDVKKILDELANWARHVGRDLFPDCIGEYSLSRIDSSWCVWMPNGEIDHRKSAQKMLNSGGLNDVQEFVVMSKYCMEEKIRTVSLESLPEYFDKVTYRDDSLLFYWICYLRNELHKVPYSGYRSVDMSMVQQCYGDERREALEYFWRRSLNHAGHRASANLVVEKCGDTRTWSILERLLTSVHTDFSSSTYIRRTLIASSIYSKSSRYPLWLWNRFKHRITVEEFFELISEMLVKCVHLEEKMSLLTHIWDTADDHRRNGSVLRLHRSIIFNFCFARDRDPPCPTAVQFLQKYFLLLSSDGRNSYFDRCFAPVLVFVSSAEGVHLLDEILEWRSVGSAELCQFKKRIKLCHELLTLGCVSVFTGNFERINVAVNWLVSHEGADAVRECKKKILRYAYHESVVQCCVITFLTDYEKWTGLCSFIDETYAEDTRSAFILKRDFVHSWTLSCCFELHFRDAFDSVKKIIESVFESEELKGCKRKLLVEFGDRLQQYEYWRHEPYCDEKFFVNFVDWCCDSDPVKISQFKCEVPYDALLSAVLDSLTRDNVYEFQRPVVAGILLARLQKYLLWYLRSEQSVNEYKLDRINDTSTDLTFLKIISKKNESCLMVILKWFFNGCETNINTFMLKNSAVLNV